MALTSAVLPAAATAHRAAGTLRAHRIVRDSARAPVPAPPLAVLLDRDGTLVHDVPYNKDPALVLPLPGARQALDRLRAHGIRLAIVSNQSGIARGLLDERDVADVMLSTVQWLGPIDDVRWCPHGPAEGCACRKPAPGMLRDAAAALGVDPLRCALIGDIGADVEAAAAAGMRGVLVPTAATEPAEIATAAECVTTLSRRRRPAAGRRVRAVGAWCPPRDAAGPAGAGGGMTRALVARLDNDGDVLLAGPAIRAIAAGCEHVTLLCGPRGAQAAAMLPGVDEVIVRRGEWIDPEAPTVDRAEIDTYVSLLATQRADVAAIFTSVHQSALPLALLLRMAGVPRIAAISEDFPGSLLDHRLPDPGDVPEPERTLGVAAALGFALPASDDGGLRVRAEPPPRSLPPRYVVVHPGASVPARAWAPARHAELVARLVGRRTRRRGHRRACGAGAHRRASPGATPSTSAAPRRWPSWPVSWPAPTPSWSATPARRTWPPPSARPSSRSSLRPCPPRAGARTASRTSCCTARCPAPAAGRASARSRATPVSPACRSTRCSSRLRAWRRAPALGRPRRWSHEDPALARARVVDDGLRPRPPRLRRPGRRRPRARRPRPRTDLGLARQRRGARARGAARGADFDVVVLQRPTRADRADARRGPAGARGATSRRSTWSTTRRRDGSPSMRHPAADRGDLVVAHVTHFNDLFWDCGTTPTRVIEHGIVDPGHRYTGALPARRRRHQRGAPPWPCHRHRSAGALRARRRPDRPVRHGRRRAWRHRGPPAAPAARRAGPAALLPAPDPLDVARPVADRGDALGDARRRARHDRGRQTPSRRPPASSRRASKCSPRPRAASCTIPTRRAPRATPRASTRWSASG